MQKLLDILEVHYKIAVCKLRRMNLKIWISKFVNLVSLSVSYLRLICMQVSYVQEQTKSVWGEEDLPCISLVTGASTMHKLR